MLREIVSTASADRRRWFSSATMDLIIWLDEEGEAVGFQLCYDKSGNERALVWRTDSPRLTWRRVDDGERSRIGHKASPILLPGEPDSIERVMAQFVAESTAMPVQWVALVVGVLQTQNVSATQAKP
jgi:hypothetical protein